jgi:trans-aconitate methyltransferase
MDNINSREYWNNRFASNWLDSHGPEQTTFFTELAVENIPKDMKSNYFLGKMKFVDYGCAEGDGLQVWEKSFPSLSLTGFDFSKKSIELAKDKYPQFKFKVRDLISSATNFRKTDIVYCSNLLEHITNWEDAIEKLAQFARHVLILQVPLQEEHLHPEHVNRFITGDFPETLSGGRLHRVEIISIDCRNFDPSYWDGEQALVYYERR